MVNIEKRYPSVAEMEKAARRAMPGFVRDYLVGGIGGDVCLARNRSALDDVLMMPRYMSQAAVPDIGCRLFGRDFDAPFGVAPLGLSGLMWPGAERKLATGAQAENIPYVLSTVATESLENVRSFAGENAWFQYYPANDARVEQSILDRCERAGYEVVVVTVDVPVHTRRAHDIRNGLSVPPAFDLKTVTQMMTHPRWALGMLREGVPQFTNITPYYEEGESIAASVKFLTKVMKGHITQARFDEIRRRWPGKLLVKGVLDAGEATRYLDSGADGLVISNHGGRQADAAPSAVNVLPRIREQVGTDAVLLADGGARCGLDIAKMLALGANFVLLGRPFVFALAALDSRGPEHVIGVLKAEMRADLGQLGCPTIRELASFLYAP